MIDLIFGAIMGIIGNIGAFIIVAGLLGFIFLLPLAINGGWIFYVMLAIFAVPAIIAGITDDKNKDDENKEER